MESKNLMISKKFVREVIKNHDLRIGEEAVEELLRKLGEYLESKVKNLKKYMDSKKIKTINKELVDAVF